MEFQVMIMFCYTFYFQIFQIYWHDSSKSFVVCNILLLLFIVRFFRIKLKYITNIIVIFNFNFYPNNLHYYYLYIIQNLDKALLILLAHQCRHCCPLKLNSVNNNSECNKKCEICCEGIKNFLPSGVPLVVSVVLVCDISENIVNHTFHSYRLH